jgi:hypothetical protein
VPLLLSASDVAPLLTEPKHLTALPGVRGVVLFINQDEDRADVSIMRYVVDWARANDVGTEFQL